MTGMTVHDDSERIAADVAEAFAARQPICVAGGRSKTFLGRTVDAPALAIPPHGGLVNYEAAELVLTARAGTPIAEIEEILAAEGQTLPFDPPRFSGSTTFGGAVAAGISGPGRPFRGSVRDAVLGVRIVNGRGERLRFGGEVMKNVAGYDASRLMVGAQGTLGVLLDISVKLAPRPARDVTVTLDESPESTFTVTERCLRRGLPIMGAAHDGNGLRLRLAGSASAVEAGIGWLDGRASEEDAFWADLRDHRLAFFTDDGPPLWRIALPPGRALTGENGRQLVDWAGRQIWLRTTTPGDELRDAVDALGGHATLYSGVDGGTEAVFTPLPPAIMRFHERLKDAFDPARILNPGRLYDGL